MRTRYPKHLPGFPYIGYYAYSSTFCTSDRSRLFADDDSVSLTRSQMMRAADAEAFSVVAGCFMPDHVHLVVIGVREDSDLKRFIKLAKQHSGFHYSRATGRCLRQRYSYEHVRRDDEDLVTKVRYVLEHPVRTGIVATARDYAYVGSSV